MKRQTGGNAIRAQGAAFKLVDTYGFQCPSDIDLESLVIDRGLEIRYGGLSGCEARLVRLGEHGIIRTRNQDIGSPRCRFAIAHELGHWELHNKSQAFFCTSEKLRDYQKDPQESEANTFASELLMPTPMLRPILETNEFGMATARLVADGFQVSVTAAAFRMILETRLECVLVCSKNKRVEWWMAGTQRFGVWLESKQNLSSETVAYYCDGKEPDPVEPEKVPSEAWFLHLKDPDSLEVVEDSMRLGNTGYVLSLLTLSDLD